jgi:hypothetical protein
MSDLLSDVTMRDLDAYAAAEEELDPYDEYAGMAEALREALADDYRDVPPEDIESTLVDMFGSLSPAESVSFSQALRQIGATVNDPVFRQIAATALPIAGTAVGTLVGGPVGTAIGGSLGSIAANSLAPTARPAAPPAAPRPAVAAAMPQVAAAPPPAAAPTPDAATKALLMLGLPAFQQLLVAAAMGQAGRQSVNGVPAATAFQLLSALLGKAAEDADQLMGESDEASLTAFDAEAELRADPLDPLDRADSLYRMLVESANEQIADEAGWR